MGWLSAVAQIDVNPPASAAAHPSRAAHARCRPPAARWDRAGRAGRPRRRRRRARDRASWRIRPFRKRPWRWPGPGPGWPDRRACVAGRHGRAQHGGPGPPPGHSRWRRPRAAWGSGRPPRPRARRPSARAG